MMHKSAQSLMDVLIRLMPELSTLRKNRTDPKLANLLYNQIWSKESNRVSGKMFRRPNEVKQAEIDRLWTKLIENGGEESRCGWLVDKFGMSWQIVPRQLGSLLGNSDRAKAGRAMQAMMGMQKLDLGKLQAAFDGV